MALIEMAKPDFPEGAETEKRIRRIEDYLFKLDEQLRYLFTHIDEENMTDDLRALIGRPAEEGGRQDA